MDFKEPENPEKPQLSEKELLTNIVGILKPKETVAKALQRLGNKQGKSKVLPSCYFINVFQKNYLHGSKRGLMH